MYDENEKYRSFHNIYSDNIGKEPRGLNWPIMITWSGNLNPVIISDEFRFHPRLLTPLRANAHYFIATKPSYAPGLAPISLWRFCLCSTMSKFINGLSRLTRMMAWHNIFVEAGGTVIEYFSLLGILTGRQSWTSSADLAVIAMFIKKNQI